MNLVVDIYTLSKNKDLSKDYGLVDQIRRASVSVPANISEGYQRGNKQYANYLLISSGSCNEVITYLNLIKKLYKVNTDDLVNHYTSLAKQIYSLYKKLRSDS